VKVFLGIPFRDDGNRLEIFKTILPWLKDNYRYDWVEVIDSDHDPFNRAATRNLIVKRAIDVGADVVVINDADSICESTPLEEAINECYSDGRLHIPFDQVAVCGAGQLMGRPRRHPTRARAYHLYGPSCGGVYVIRPQRWKDLGGMDERIRGWGFEDEIIIVTSRAFIGGYTHHRGQLYTFQHPRLDVEVAREENIALRDRYHRLEGKKNDIRRLQSGSNDFRPRSW
jgi:hypothetical protein